VIAKEDSVRGLLEMLVRYKNPGDSSVSLSLFGQLGTGQFLERSIRPNFPDRIAALTVDDFTNNGRYDLIFVTHDRARGRSTLFTAPGEEEFDFRTVSPLLSFADTVSSVDRILLARVNPDTLKDAVVFMGHPRNSIGIAYGLQGGTFDDSLEWIPNVVPQDEDATILQDADGDGLTDFIVIDSGRKSVIAVYGQPRGGFTSPVTICPAEGISSIRVASMKQPPIKDLILANGAKGIVSIMFQPFRR
jgi:hypothetical protein